MFEHQPIIDVLRELEAVQMMLPEEEQEFLQGCAYTAETGGVLSQHNIQRVRQIYSKHSTTPRALTSPSTCVRS